MLHGEYFKSLNSFPKIFVVKITKRNYKGLLRRTIAFFQFCGGLHLESKNSQFFFFKLFFNNLIFKGRHSADTFYFLAQKRNTVRALHFPTRRLGCLLLKG